jgi:hypothetical protein
MMASERGAAFAGDDDGASTEGTDGAAVADLRVPSVMVVVPE